MSQKPKQVAAIQQGAMGRPRLLSKSRFKLATECPTKLYFNDRPKEYANKKSDDSFLKNLARGGFQVGALARLYFPGGIEVATLDYEESVERTNELMALPNVIIFEAAFRFENLFIRADVVQKKGDIVELFEVKAGSHHPEDSFWQVKDTTKISNEWKDYLYDIAFQHFVASKAWPNLTFVPHLYLADKSAAASVDGLNQMFRLTQVNGRDRVTYDATLSESTLGTRILRAVPVSNEVKVIQEGRANGAEPPDWPPAHTFETWIRLLAEAYEHDHQVPPRASKSCKDCEFRVSKAAYPDLKVGFEECWTKALTLTEQELSRRVPIFEIWNANSTKFLADGINFVDGMHADDFIPKSKPKKDVRAGLTRAERQAYQLEQVLAKKPEAIFKSAEFKEEAARCVYPLHFIDFEGSTVAIPFHKGMRPYEQVAFQFSHHVMEKDGTVRHEGQWLNTEPGKFPNFEFIRNLKRELEKDSGTIFRYHYYENTVLNQVRVQLKEATATDVPDKDDLIRWIETIAVPTGKTADKWTPSRPMVDLFDFVLRFFWHPRMRGSNSIKVVLPAILEASPYLQKFYSQPAYGNSNGIPSKNYQDFVWCREEGGSLVDPYQLLPRVFGNDREKLDRLYSDEELADGGAAMMAYAKLQFTEMSKEERAEIESALLRYCELDTLAMVMLWQGWMNHG